ncbi:MAG: TRAP transporter small permease subunit [Ekhidna sp.]|uniref:TRAP transporter small permease subunit n=1 Tax=Ekhidna sp. TaxID=2608089 RepID=UPI0032ECCAC6
MRIIDQAISLIGRATSWLTVLLVLVIVIDVFLRYVFNATSAASFELEWHLFAVIFLLGAAWTLQEDKHVRVDVFYHSFSESKKAWVNLIGTLLLLLPFCAVGFWESLSFVESSYSLGETSPQPGGLPARWIIKSTIPVGFFLLGLQGISLILKAINIIRNGRRQEVTKS